MSDALPPVPEDAPSGLALLTLLSRTVYRVSAEREGSSSRLKQFIALSYLRELGEVGQSMFGSVLCLDANNTVLLLNDLEAAGVVVRKRCESDRRRHVIALTDTGLEVLKQFQASMADVEDELLAALTDDQRAQLRALLHQTLYGPGGPYHQANADPVAAGLTP